MYHYNSEFIWALKHFKIIVHETQNFTGWFRNSTKLTNDSKSGTYRSRKSGKIPCVLLGRYLLLVPLTHWDLVRHKDLCVTNLTIIVADNGLSPGRRQNIIWTYAKILLTGPLGTEFSEVLVKIGSFSFKEMHLKMSSGNWRPFVSASMN